MLWILIGIVLVVGSVALAHRALAEWWPEGRPAVSTALVYAAAVALGAQVLGAALDISAITDDRISGGAGDEFQIKNILLSAVRHLTETAWQVGLLVALAVLVAWASARVRPPAGAPPA